jgi:hypothetical protein
VDNLFAFVRLYIFGSAPWAFVVTTTTPNVCPFLTILGTTIIVDELPIRHFSSSKHRG